MLKRKFIYGLKLSSNPAKTPFQDKNINPTYDDNKIKEIVD